MAGVEYTTDGALAFIRLNKPPANTYDFDFFRELDDAVNRVRLDDTVQVAILASTSPKFFSAGAEISFLKASTPRYKAAFCMFCQETLAKMERTPKIFIACLE